MAFLCLQIRCHKRSFLGDRLYGDISNARHQPRPHSNRLSAFIEVCPYSYCNENIMAYSSMGGEINKVIDELIAYGFKHQADFLFIDAGLYLMVDNCGPFPVDLEVGWLEGRFEDGGVYVRFVESMPGFPLKPRKLGVIPETVARSLEPPIGDDVPLPNIN
jgi:hypothetical protein